MVVCLCVCFNGMQNLGSGHSSEQVCPRHKLHCKRINHLIILWESPTTPGIVISKNAQPQLNNGKTCYIGGCVCVCVCVCVSVSQHWPECICVCVCCCLREHPWLCTCMRIHPCVWLTRMHNDCSGYSLEQVCPRHKLHCKSINHSTILGESPANPQCH